MNSRSLKPDLLDQQLRDKICHGLIKPSDNYWVPVKKDLSTIRDKFFIPNLFFFIAIIILIIFLIYRYNMASRKKKRD